MPNNGSNISVVMIHHDALDQNENATSVSTKQAPQIYSAKRRWSIGKMHSIEEQDTTPNNRLERRMTLPHLKAKDRNSKCELRTPVQNEGNFHNESQDYISRNSLLTFWKSEDDLNVLVSKIDLSSYEDVMKICDIVHEKQIAEDMSVTEISKLVQTIYRTAKSKMKRANAINIVNDDDTKTILAKFEDRLMRGLHSKIFEKILLEERENDNNLCSIIEGLAWVTPKHLLAKIDDSDKTVSDIFDKAMLDIATMHFKESPVAKLRCIMNCTSRIFEILKLRHDLSEPADDFLSILVFVILQSNPACLHSNICYILQFGNCDQIMRGEEGYYFTHLCSAVSYIENLNAQSLNLSEDEFLELKLNHIGIDEKRLNSRSRRLSCSRQISLCICKIYHQAAHEKPLKPHEINFRNSVPFHKKVLLLDIT